LSKTEADHFLSAVRAARMRFLSAEYLHQGFFGSPLMNRTSAMYVSSKQGSWRTPVKRQRLSYIV
jgi:hypothetical protein